MILLSEAHMRAWKAQILSPSHLVRRTPVYTASFPLTHYPASKCAGSVCLLEVRRYRTAGTDEIWSARKFIEAGFPENR